MQSDQLMLVKINSDKTMATLIDLNGDEKYCFKDQFVYYIPNGREMKVESVQPYGVETTWEYAGKLHKGIFGYNVIKLTQWDS